MNITEETFKWWLLWVGGDWTMSEGQLTFNSMMGAAVPGFPKAEGGFPPFNFNT